MRHAKKCVFSHISGNLLFHTAIATINSGPFGPWVPPGALNHINLGPLIPAMPMNFSCMKKANLSLKKRNFRTKLHHTKNCVFSHYSGASLSQFALMAINPCSFDPWVPPGAPNHTKLVPFTPVTTSIFPWQEKSAFSAKKGEFIEKKRNFGILTGNFETNATPKFFKEKLTDTQVIGQLSGPTSRSELDLFPVKLAPPAEVSFNGVIFGNFTQCTKKVQNYWTFLRTNPLCLPQGRLTSHLPRANLIPLFLCPFPLFTTTFGKIC